jgi:hypothetical protein
MTLALLALLAIAIAIAIAIATIIAMKNTISIIAFHHCSPHPLPS